MYGHWAEDCTRRPGEKCFNCKALSFLCSREHGHFGLLILLKFIKVARSAIGQRTVYLVEV